MFKIILATAALASLTACAIPNGFNPAAAAAQDAHNEALKATVSPDGAPLPAGTVVVQ